MRKSSNRKSTPPGEMPSEAWRVVLEPQWLNPGYKYQFGLGCEGFTEPTSLQKWIRKLLAVIYATERLPIQCVISYGASLPKRYVSAVEEAQVCDMERTIHMYSAFTQNLGKAISVYGDPFDPPTFGFGAIKKQRREEAICIQLHNQWRCWENKATYICKMYDVKNAFYSITFEDTQRYWYSKFDGEGKGRRLAKQVFEQLIENNFTIRECLDGYVLVNNSGGIPPGRFCATVIFNEVYRHVLNTYTANTGHYTNMLQVYSHISNSFKDCASTFFVDDVASAAATCNNEEVLDLSKNLSCNLDQAFNGHGLLQNRGKEMLVCSPVGPGSKKMMHELVADPCTNVCENARYLGPHINWKMKCTYEVNRRVQLAWNAWYAHSKLCEIGGTL